MRLLALLTLFLLSSCSSSSSSFRMPASDINCSKLAAELIQESTTKNVSFSSDAEIIKTYIFQGPILNFYLRNKNNPAYDAILDLDKLIEKYSNNLETKIYFRGESRPNDGSVHVGARLNYENYISTTRDKELALGYANGNGDDSMLSVVYEIKVEAGDLGFQINEMAPVGVRNQDEFLLGRDGHLIVEEITNIDGITYVKATYEKI